jgi:hypothetical protein
MFNRLAIALGVAVVFYVTFLLVKAYKPSWFGYDAFTTATTAVEREEVPGFAPPMQQQPRVEPPLVTTPSGPSPPNAIPNPKADYEPPEVPPEVEAHDPYDSPNSSSNLQDSLRQPQRMFSPGVVPTDTRLVMDSGSASPFTQVTAQSLQTFTPEMAMNGGEFMKGIAANDTTSDMNYASF